MTVNGVLFGAAIAGLLLLLIWHERARSALFSYLARDKMPIWLSLALGAGAAGGTYVIAPMLNQDFEFQKNRSAHLLQTETELNKLSVELAISVRRFNDSLFYQRRDINEKRDDLLDKITELQWRLIDVDVVIRRAKTDDTSVKRLSASLDALHKAAINAKSPKDQEQVIASSLQVANAARKCIYDLYKAANLDTD